MQNEYVETVQAVRAVEQSAQQLKQTKDDYSKYKSEVKNLEVKLSSLQTSYKNKEVGVDSSDIEDLKEIISNLKSQEKYYVAAISAATADLASKTTAAISQAKAAATSEGTAGFSAGVSLDVNGNKTNTNSNSITSNASNLNANNILLQTNNKLNTNVNITGSNVIANENLNVNTHNLNVIASQDSSNQTQNSKSVNGSVAYTMYGGGGGTAGLGYGTNNSNSNSVVNHNSNLQANNMNINVSNDANFQGATVRANDTLNLKVGNNLNVESVRDEYSSSNKGFNVNAGVGFGSAGAQQNRTPSLDVGNQSSTNAGFSINNGISLDKQTLTSINQILSTDRATVIDFFKETEKNVKVLDGIRSTISSNPELAKQLSDPNITPEQKQSMINNVATTVAISLGFIEPNTKLVYTDETGASNEQIKGHYSTQTNTSYVNDKNNDSTVELVNTTAHETQHYMDAIKNVVVTDKADNEKYVNNFANTVADYVDYALSYTGNQSMATTNNHNQSSSSSVLIENNKEFSGVDKSLGEDRTVIYIWKGVGYGSSAFGHVSTSVNDTSYSFGPHGMDIESLSDYMNRQAFRRGIAVEIPLSATEEKKFENSLKVYNGVYGINFCPSPVNQGLQNLGYKFDSQIIPMSFYMELMKNNIGINPTIIEKTK